MKNYNSMFFKDVKSALELVDVLLKDNDDLFNDTHIYIEDVGVVVEWAQVPFDHSYGGRFAFVDEDAEVMLFKDFPDGHYEYFSNEEEYKEAFDQWLKDNPKWKKNQWGMWVEEENEDAASQVE